MAARPSPAGQPSAAPHWTQTVYREHADLFYAVEAALFQNPELTRQELDRVGELAREVDAAIRSPLVDLACGPGRHSLELARRGHAVTGVDLSERFLARAHAAATGLEAGSPAPRFVCGDLRRLMLASDSFHTALLLGNSFGYFDDDENRAMLDEMRRVLRPGGLLVMEITHRDAYLARLRAYEEEVIRLPRRERLRCQWWKSWDAETRRVRTRERHSRVSTGEVVYEGPYDVRLYGEDELRRLLEAAGFHGCFSLPFTPDRDSLEGGLGETFGAMTEVLFVAARG